MHRDAQGSVRQITSAAGVSDQRRFYLSYGAVSLSTVAVTNPAADTKGWIGERFDADAGLQYLNARYYDPQLGMFLQPDWWEVMQPGVGTNRYSYSFGDPVNGIDPSGHSTYVVPNNKTAQKNDYLVKEVIKDRDKNIYITDRKMPKEKWVIIGKTKYWDSFQSPETNLAVGVIYKGESLDQYFSKLKTEAGGMIKQRIAYESLPGKMFDVKANYPGHENKSYHGFLLDGKYVSLRDAGNILAGWNAAQQGVEWDEFQSKAGSLQVNGKLGLFYNFLGFEAGPPPNYGELDYQRTRSFDGFNSYPSQMDGPKW